MPMWFTGKNIKNVMENKERIMKNNIEIIYEKILENLNEEEKQHSEYLIYTGQDFIKYQTTYKKDNLSINIKLKENRKSNFIEILNRLKIKYKVSNDNQYYTIFELKENSNYIVIDYVVNSHITIPKSILVDFGYKTQDGTIIDYINVKDMKIESKKTKEYGSEYGYYSKIIEDTLNRKFEKQIGEIRNKIHSFKNKKINSLRFTKNEINDIYNFFDITTYRNVKMVKQVNEESITSILIGGYTHDQLLHFALRENFQHVYEGLKFNVIINNTARDFVICDTLISAIYCDGSNEVIILPINKKECLVLMDDKYYQKYFINGNLYFMNMEKEDDVLMLNKYIFKRAIQNKENIIGTRNELETLLEQYK